jgi:hypothetical protein
MVYNSDASKERGCGFKKIGGLYLCGDYVPVSCDRLPYPLPVCPICGSGIKVGRGFTKINPKELFGHHISCHDEHQPCMMCQPKKGEISYIIRIGERYYPSVEAFLAEGVAMGFSRRIAQIPRDFKVGKTVVYLAHINACVVKEPVAIQEAMGLLEESQMHLIDSPKEKRVMGIFTAFIPQRIEKIYWESDLEKMTDEEKKALAKRQITPIGVEYDPKHM